MRCVTRLSGDMNRLTYLPTQVDRAKVLSNTIKQKRKEKAGKWEVPLPKVRHRSCCRDAGSWRSPNWYPSGVLVSTIVALLAAAVHGNITSLCG